MYMYAAVVSSWVITYTGSNRWTQLFHSIRDKYCILLEYILISESTFKTLMKQHKQHKKYCTFLEIEYWTKIVSLLVVLNECITNNIITFVSISQS